MTIFSDERTSGAGSPPPARPVPTGVRPPSPLADGVRELVAAADRYLSDAAEATGADRQALAVLDLLDAAGPLAPSVLARRLDCSPAGVTCVLDRLERSGLAIRRRHPLDRRSVLVEPTPAGSRLVSGLVAAFEAELDGAVGDTSPDERSALVAAVRRIAARLQVAAPRPPRP